jgi:hypothetical protein
MSEELYIDPNLPEWKKKHLREQERRRLAALQEQQQAPVQTGPTPEQVAAMRQAEEEEKARIAALQEEERQRRAVEERERLKREAQERMSKFAGSAVQVEREEVLKELVPSRAKSSVSGVSPRTQEPTSPRSAGGAALAGASTGNVWQLHEIHVSNLLQLPEWKRKQMEAEQERLK